MNDSEVAMPQPKLLTAADRRRCLLLLIAAAVRRQLNLALNAVAAAGRRQLGRIRGRERARDDPDPTEFRMNQRFNV